MAADKKIQLAKDRHALSSHISKIIAESLPPEFVADCVQDAVRQYIVEFRVNDYEVRDVIKELLKEKVREILKTKYVAQVEAAAEQLAQKALAGANIR